jgi:hypothetical protein
LPKLAQEGGPEGAITQLGMAMRLGEGDALVEQPSIELLIALYPQSRAEEALAHQPDLVLDLALLHRRQRRRSVSKGAQATGLRGPEARGAGHRLDQVVPVHLQEATVVGAILADQDRLHAVFMLS